MTDHEIKDLANRWAKELPNEDIGIRTAFAKGFKMALEHSALKEQEDRINYLEKELERMTSLYEQSQEYINNQNYEGESN